MLLSMEKHILIFEEKQRPKSIEENLESNKIITEVTQLK